MASPLHDNKRSKELEGDKAKPKPAEGEKKAEEKPAGYIGGDSEPGDTTRKRDEGEKKPPAVQETTPTDAGKAEVVAGDAAPAPKDMFLDGIKSMKERHMKERRDAHGQHKANIEAMGKRHEKEFSDHYDLHFKEPQAEAAGADAGGGGAVGTTGSESAGSSAGGEE